MRSRIKSGMTAQGMKLYSWNVNGIRSVMKKGFLNFIQETPFDVLCLQEIRATQEQANLTLPDMQIYWNDAEKKGYSGTAVLTRTKPESISFDLSISKHDNEGRVITLEFKNFFLVNVYTPNSQRGLARLPYRTQEWDVDFLAYLKKLEKTKPVVLCGDLNVAHKEIDLANPKSNRKNAGFTDEERAGFDRLVESGFVDTFREFTKEGGHYTWWSRFANARERNIGWRIDYFCVSKSIRARVKKSFILPKVMGSDHCPVGVVLDPSLS